MRDGILLWLWLLTMGTAWAQPYEGRTLPPANIPDLQELIERKHQEVIAEDSMPIDRLGLELALAHHYVRTHKCPDTTHFHDYVVYDEDRIADEIIKRYGKE